MAMVIAFMAERENFRFKIVYRRLAALEAPLLANAADATKYRVISSRNELDLSAAPPRPP